MEYRVVSEGSCIELELEVNSLIKKGWRPQGGLVFQFSGLKSYFKQAMVKSD